MNAKHLILVETPERASELGWPWLPSGFGLLLCEENGERFTLTFGLEYARLMADAVEAGALDDETTFPMGKFPLRKEGWPAGLTTGALKARCPACHGVMNEVDGCTAVAFIHAYRYGEEPQWAEMDLEPLPRCRDCGARLGHHHHLHCLNAWCMECRDQAACCEHNVAP